MRLSQDMQQAILERVHEYVPEASVYVFGSRANDTKKGGDIDILVLDDRVLTLQEKNKIITRLWMQFGEQKIDIASFTRDSDDPFKRLVMEHAVEIV